MPRSAISLRMDDVLILVKAIPVCFTALLPVINPLGTSIILLSLTPRATPALRSGLAKSIAMNMVLLLTVLLLGGSYLLSFFGISVSIVQFAGGIVLASMGWRLLNQTDTPSQAVDVSANESPDYSGKAFYPFTFPLTVGPGSVAVILTLSAHTTHGEISHTILAQVGADVGILANSVLMYVCFANSDAIARRLGPSGTTILMRLIAFIVVCIGAQISWTGIQALIHTL